MTVEFHEGTNMAVAPSPDGQRLVFSAQGALWVMPVTGSAATRITGWELEPTAPVWSPDGKTIAFQNYAPEGNYHIWTVAPDGGSPVELTTGPNDDREPAWLPDGSGLVFSSDRSNDGQYKIWSVKLSGNALAQLTTGAGAESNPIVSPDGRQLAFVDTGNVFTTTIGGAAAPVAVAAGTAPAWNPAGSGLVYQTPTQALVVGGKEVSTTEDIFPFPARYLPDGRFIYTADGKIRVRDAAGANPQDIAFSASLTVRRPVISTPKDHGFSNVAARPVVGISAPALSPDGKSVAFVALNDVWVMAIGQAPVRLTNDTDRDGSPQWTPDGAAVYFSSEKGNAGQLAADQINIATKVRTRLASIAGKSMVTPKMSPAGDRIAYTTLSGQLEIWTIASKSAQVILPSISTQVSTAGNSCRPAVDPGRADWHDAGARRRPVGRGQPDAAAQCGNSHYRQPHHFREADRGRCGSRRHALCGRVGADCHAGAVGPAHSSADAIPGRPVRADRSADAVLRADLDAVGGGTAAPEH